LPKSYLDLLPKLKLYIYIYIKLANWISKNKTIIQHASAEPEKVLQHHKCSQPYVDNGQAIIELQGIL
jgi:hypothetical protein